MREIFGHSYDVAEPRGPAAIKLYGQIIGVYERSGAGDVIQEVAGKGPEEAARAVQKAARLLAAHPDGNAAARATLAGATCDGAPLDWSAYSAPGRFLEPYLVALGCWVDWGFLLDGAGSPAVP